MEHDEIFFIKPLPSTDYRLELQQHIKRDGYNLSYIDKRVFIEKEMKSVLLKKGVTAILTNQQLKEEVLPDNTPRNVVLDTLRYKIDQCEASQSILIIDPYLFPFNSDSDYLSDLIKIFENSIKKCVKLEIATLSNRNQTLQQQMQNKISEMNQNIKINYKYTNVFHDRFWIADNTRGVFVGTSLNGIGKKYAIIDWLQEDDAKAIVNRYRQLP